MILGVVCCDGWIGVGLICEVGGCIGESFCGLVLYLVGGWDVLWFVGCEGG